MRYILDTNILVYLMRENTNVISALQEMDIFGTDKTVISFASFGESLAFSLKNKWGVAKKEKLEILLKVFEAVPMSSRPLADAYAEIDAFSQGRHPTLKSTFSARNMGKMTCGLPQPLTFLMLFY